MLSLRLSLSGTDIITKLVFEKIGVPIAQFVSILNILMLAGVIATILSRVRVFESIVGVYLREFYRQTSANLI